jgi:hypothetical protein
MHAYDELYVPRAQTNLGQMFRFAEEDLGKEVDVFLSCFCCRVSPTCSAREIIG